LKTKWKYLTAAFCLAVIVGVSIIYCIKNSNGQESSIVEVKSPSQYAQNDQKEVVIGAEVDEQDNALETVLSTQASSAGGDRIENKDLEIFKIGLGQLGFDNLSSHAQNSDAAAGKTEISGIASGGIDIAGAGIETGTAPVKGTGAAAETPAGISTQEESTAVVQTLKGYIIDKCCLTDPGPEDDTIDCLLMDSCRASGYGLAIKNGSGYIWYEFDKVGKDRAFAILKATTKYKKISVTVKGTVVNAILHVSEINEG